MKIPQENSQPILSHEAIQVLKDREDQILTTLSELKEQGSYNRALQDIERLGGLGNFGFSLEGIIGFVEGTRKEVGARNARFDVAFLNVASIKGFIVSHCDGRITIMDLDMIRDALTEYL